LVKRNCLICAKPVDSATDADFPFCSERCKLLDLGNWASERYVISEPALEEPAPEKRDPDESKN